MNINYLFNFSNITVEEMMYLKELITNLNEEEQKTFAMIYSGKRRDPQHLLLFTILGFFGVAGVQRFVTNQIGMGIVYFLTAGFCFIGTIIDLVNYKSLANEYNHKMALETRRFMEMMKQN
jgi:TM2 domain-containing membrane protein YozV